MIDFRKLKVFFTKNLMLITILFPLIIIIFYGTSLSIALKYKHETYTQQELKRYEAELRDKHKKFLKEKAHYIKSFMEFLYQENLQDTQNFFKRKILNFVSSLKKYDSGSVFIFKEDGTLIKHPCASKLINLNNTNHNSVLEKLIEASRVQKFAYYQGIDCDSKKFVKKIAYIHHIKDTDFYIIISKNEKEIACSIAEQKKIWEKKIDDELQENIKLLIIVSLMSILLSLLFSRILNILIKDYEKEIKESNSAMFAQSRLAQAGELLSMISHQWRQPISKIASLASNLRFQMIMNQNIEPSILDNKLEEIEEHTEFLSETIDDFREFYKPKQKKEQILILPLINKAIGFLENEISKKNIRIKKIFDDDTKILLYPNELIQVIINIIQNAIEFSNQEAQIEIQTKIKKDEYVISITDEAGGITKENLPKIFDAHFSTKDHKESTNLGLGLYVSKVIIEKHFNGKIEVQTHNKNTTFTIRLIR